MDEYENGSDIIEVIASRYTQQWRIQEYTSISLVALFVPFIFLGNIMVILSVKRYKRLQMPTNYFLVSLAAADIFIAITLPFYVVTELTEINVKNDYVCLTSNRMLMTAGGVSIVTLAVIAYDRYTAIMHPLEYISLMTGWRIGILVTSTWIYSALVAWLPMFIGWHGTTQDPIGLCTNGVLNRKAQILFVSALFGPSCCCILYCYFRIFLVARHHATAIAAVEMSLKQNLEQQFVRKDTKYAKTLAVVIGVFLLLWLPYLICLIIEIVNYVVVDSWLKNYLMLLAFLNSGVNPWVYAYQNNEFRAAYKKLSGAIRWRICCDKRGVRSASTVSEVSTVCTNGAAVRLSRIHSRIAASEMFYVLSRQVGTEQVDNTLAQRLGPQYGVINAVYSIPDILKLYIHNNPEQVLTVLEEAVSEISAHEETSKDSAYSMHDFHSDTSSGPGPSQEPEHVQTRMPRRELIEVCVHAASDA